MGHRIVGTNWKLPLMVGSTQDFPTHQASWLERSQHPLFFIKLCGTQKIGQKLCYNIWWYLVVWKELLGVKANYPYSLWELRSYEFPFPTNIVYRFSGRFSIALWWVNLQFIEWLLPRISQHKEMTCAILNIYTCTFPSVTISPLVRKSTAERCCCCQRWGSSMISH